MSYIFTFSGNALSIFLDGVPQTIDSSHPKWVEIFDVVSGKSSADEAELRKLIDTRSTVTEAVIKADVSGVTVGHDCILLNGKPVHSYLTRRMLEMVSAGVDITPWKNFLAKLYQNPSRVAVNELYLWLEKANMPLVENGNFLAYKKVRDDYTSYHRNADGSECHNDIGTIVEMPRNEVDDQRENTCSYGLHFCSYHYLPSYYGSEGRVLIVEINPADVVSIPSDYDNAKGRAHRYLVRGEVDRDKVQFAFGGVLVTPVSDYESAWDEDDEDEDEGDRRYDADMDLWYDSNTFMIELDTINWDMFEADGKPWPNDDGTYSLTFLHTETDGEITAVLDDKMEVISASV